MQTDWQAALGDFKFKMKLALRWSDVDEAGHVNNAVYLTYFEETRVVYFNESVQWDWKKDGVILANANVNYIRPLFYPENAFVYARTIRIGSKSLELEYIVVVENGDKKDLIAKGTTVLVMFDYKSNQSVAVPAEIRAKLNAYEQKTF
ncbi:MAG: acyl-CoA thioesterase [Chitinophagales bacterium]|nr:acyl-CoA thioesterase [Chitinophagales bacterium]